jgi:hypothetical protein
MNVRSHTEMKPMDAKTLEALRGSIKKWEGIVAGTTMDLGPANCPLCQRFIDNDDCAGCPVAFRTGQDSCAGSPYDEWTAAEEANDSVRLARAAQAELDFLKSLLPKEAVTDEKDLTP